MPPNILLIVVDTTRADIFYNLMEGDELSTIQSIADDGKLYEKAISNSCWTLPSHASIFTGQRVHDHKTHAGNKQFEAVQPLPETLSKSGYRTLGISGNVWISSEFGFDKGFDNLTRDFDLFWSGEDLSQVYRAEGLSESVSTFVDIVDFKTLLPTFGNGLYAKIGRSDKGAHNTTRRTVRWLKRTAKQQQPFFYFINYLEPHLPYKPQKKYAQKFLPDEVSYKEAIELEQNPWEYITGYKDYDEESFEIFRALYKAEISYIDDKMTKLVNTLKQEGIYDNTSIIIVGDHGENIGEHELMDHQYSLHQPLVNVPLIIKSDRIQSGRNKDPVEVRDLYPTILDLAGVSQEEDPSVSQNSLVADRTRDFAISEYRAPQPSLESLRTKIGEHIPTEDKIDRTYRAIQGSQWKLIEASDGSVELYDLDSDRKETNEISDTNPEKVEEMKMELENRGIPIDYRSTDKLDASSATEQRLKDLGYI